MRDRTQITPALLSELVTYDPHSGKFWWLPRKPEHFIFCDEEHRAVSASRWNTRFAGCEAFVPTDSQGYKGCYIMGVQFRAHRVAWAVTFGVWPAHIDHINQDKSDNRLVNLQSVSKVENARNTRRMANNSSGVMGVSWDAERNLWFSYIGVASKTVGLGRFPSFEEACAARWGAERVLKFSPIHGRDA